MATVYFYKMRLFEEEKIRIRKNKEEYNKHYKAKEELEALFKSIILKKGTILKNGQNKCVPIEDAPEWVLLEVLKADKIENFNPDSKNQCNIEGAKYIFGRIGKKKDITNVQRRNRYTYEAIDIEKDPDEDMEIYTYFYLFFETSVIVYLGAQAAPGIQKINDMFLRHCSNANIKTEIAPVTAEDIVEILTHKDIVNSFEITTTLPSDEVLNIDNIGLSQSEFDKMRKEKNIKITVAISADGRNKNLFKENNLISTIVNSVLESNGNEKKRLRFKAKNNNERIQEYDIIEKMFTKSIQFKYKADEGDNRRKEIEERLFDLYIKNRRDIVRYCKD